MTNNPQFGERTTPDEPPKQREKLAPASIFWMVMLGLLIAPGIIWVWRWALGLL